MTSSDARDSRPSSVEPPLRDPRPATASIRGAAAQISARVDADAAGVEHHHDVRPVRWRQLGEQPLGRCEPDQPEPDRTGISRCVHARASDSDPSLASSTPAAPLVALGQVGTDSLPTAAA